MENKPSMSRVERLHREKVTRYSIRKYSFGAASVAVAALFMFLGNGAVSVQADQIQPVQPGDTAAAPATPTLDKTQLESYISEIETKLSNGSYDNKTEESVAVLKAELESAKATLANATTQAELKKAYSKLVTTANSKLKNKPVEKKETPAVDTTEGKETVGKTAENTEPKSESNSIENTGSNDARSGKELDKNNAFRTATDTEKPKVSIDYDDAASQTIWVTPTEETNITGRIKITDNSGKIVKGWMQKMGGGTDTNIGYGLNNSNIDGETTATADQPATLSITGKLQDRHPNGKPWVNGSTVVSRKVRAKDASNNEIDNEGSSDPAYQVFFKIRSQNVKYTEDLANKAANFDKVAVADPAQLQQAELDKIKAGLQAGDGNNLNGKIATVTQSGDKVVITYNDGTTAERPVTDFTRVNQAPTAEFPFSNAAAKEIYVYGAEENSFDIKIKDDSKKIVSATLNQGGNRPFAEVPGATNKISTQYGYTANTITAETPATEASPAVITYSGTPAPEGNFTQDKLDAATRGETPPGVVLGWRFLRVTDADGGEITGRATGADDPGSFVVVLKPQTQKYDVTKPENEAAKVPVVDANHVTDAEFAKIVGANNANIKLHYSKKNADANLVGKQGQNVDDKEAKIKSVTKVDNNMVVTYKDGSTDTLPLTDFALTNPAPVVNTKSKNTIYSTDSEITGTGTPGATVKVTVKNPEGTTVISEKTTQVGEDGTWKLPLDKGLNSNETLPGASAAARTFYAPKNKVEVTQTVNGVESEKADLEVSIGESKILPSEAAKDKTSVVAGAKKVVLTVPHDTGYSYFWYKDKETNSAPQVTLKRGEDKGWSITENSERATIESVQHGDFVDTITLTLTKPVAEGNNNIQIISHNGSASHGSYSGKYSVNVTNEAPVVSSATDSDVTTVNAGGTVDLSTLAKVTDHEDDQNATLGTKGTPTVVSINGDTSKTTLEAADLATPGTYTVKYKAVDSQGKESAEYTHTVKVNQAPTVELPYSNADKRQIYVYTGENTDLTFTGKDETEVKDLYLRGPGDVTWNNTTGFGFTTGKVENGVVTGDGTVTADKRTATIKMTGTTNLKAGQQWTSFIESKDSNDAKSMTGANYNAETDDAARQQKPGYVQFVVKSQTDKYDIKAPTEKVAVTDPANVTEAELAKIKEKLQLEHNKNNDDANISKDAPVTDKDAKIDSVTKDDQGNLVVTYKDGSKDTRPLSEFVTLDKQPAIDAVNKAADKQIQAINDNAAATQEEKDAAIAKVNADKAKALENIANSNATTKPELDKVEKAGTDAIAKDNPVVSAKPAAKKAIDDALAAKNKAIDARPDLTPEEKTKAKEAAKAAADKAKEAVDAATTDAEVTKAKEAGAKAVADVTPVAKAEAKKAIAKALEDKNSEIDKRTDLTDEEKTAAKNEAKDKADAQLAEIAKQPDAAATPAAAKTAQDVVDAAKETGVAEVTAVNPVAKAKPEAKKAIDDALAAKNKAIDARTDLTPEEKTKAKEEAQAQADVAKDAVDAATTNAAVDKAKTDGTTAVANVTPVVKEAAKKAIADELAEKEKAIDARKDLTDAEKAKAKEEAQAKAKEATDAINKQPDVATTPTAAKTAQDAVDAAKAKGVADVKAVNPVAKEAAKQAIADELAKKVGEIDARPDLTDKEKDAAKKDAQAKAKKATDAINAQPDNAETPEKAAEAQTAVDGAKDKGVADVKAVNPVAKEKAKEEIAKELAKKEEAIDGRKDLTDEEKAAAKKDAQAKAKEATDAIDAQPSIAETPEKAAEAKKAVDGAKDKGVADVKAVNPVAAKKPEAKEAVDAALKAKVDAINAREDLTPAEKDEAKKAAEKAADDAKKAIDAATTDAAVDAAKNAGTGEVAKVNPVAKEKAKEEIAKELAKKEEAIDERKDLTDEEKAAAKEEAQAKAKEATDAIDAQPANAETPEKAAEAQKAVDGAKDKGVADVKAVNPEAVTKPAAKKAIEDKLAKQLEDIANTPDATDEEKKVAADAAKALAEEAKKEIDKAGTDAEVKQLQEKAEGEIEKSVPVVEDKPNARKAIDEEATAKKAEIDARNDLTPEAKAKLKAKVDKVAEKSKAAIDAVSSVDDVNTIEEADKAAIKAIGEVNRPIDKVLVKDPSALTDEEKAKILEEVKKVNPTAKEVKYDENGNIEVTTEAGDKGIINPTKLVKTEDQLDNGKGGNDINKPLDKVIVKDPSNLTDEEKAKIVAKVEEVNPDAIVTIDENGTVSVSTPEGKTAAIPASELVRTKEDTSNPDAGNSKIVKPADKVAGEANDPDDQAKVEEKLRELNPETKSVKFDEDGNATVTLKDGTTATIPSEDLFKSEVDATKPNAGNDIVKPADKTVVANPEKLTDAEKKAIEDKVKAVNPDATVVVDDKGNATVTTPEGKTAVIPAADLTKDPAAATKPNAGNAVNTPASKVEVKDPANLTDEEKAKVKKAIEAVNPGSKVVVDDKGNATVTTPEGNTAVIPAADVTKSAADAGKANAGNAVNTPASKVEVKDPANLTPEEKKAIEDKVKAVNPDATVVVDDKGNATVTTPEGKTATIPATDLTKSASDAGKANAGNGANTPATKTVVKDPTNLTDEEKAKVKKAVEDVNPGSTVVVNDKGDVIVTKGDGTVLVIPELDLVIPEDKLTDPTQQNGVNTPATRVLVGDKAKLTADEIEKVKESIKAVNPGSTVVVDENGNATVTTPEGKTATIPAAQLVKDAKDVAAKNNGENINLDFEKETVADFNNLTDAEKEAAKAKIKGANADVLEVIFDKAGNATVITKDGKVYTIVAKDIFKQRPYVPSNGGGNNGATNTDAKVDKAKLEGAIRQLDELIIKESAKFDAETAKEANALSADAKKVFANADASQAEVDAMVKRIEDFMAKVASSTDHATPANDQAAQTPAVAPATTQAAANAGQTASAQANARKVAKELPNTGTADSTVAMVAAAASALLGLGLAGRRRKEDEEA